jgi:hypothetical protein
VNSLASNSPLQFGTLPQILRTPYQLVISPGREHTYKWISGFWETGLEDPNPSLVNPENFRCPPINQDDSDTESDYLRAHNIIPFHRPVESIPTLLARIQNRLPQVTVTLAQQDNSEGWSSPATTEPIEEAKFPVCWCKSDICYCNHRLDTPPTPPSVVLWSPGDRTLPDNRI